MHVRRYVLILALVPLVACSKCGKKQTAGNDAGAPPVATTADAGPASAAEAAKTSPDRPYDFPIAADAPDWTWPVVRIEKASNGKQQLHVVGWATNIKNPSLEKVMAEARARTSLLKVLQDKKINTPGFTNGEITGVTFPRTFQSETGAFFVEAVMDLP